MVRVSSTHLFWPSNRRLFRQRTRVRLALSIAAVVMAAGLVLGLRHAGWV